MQISSNLRSVVVIAARSRIVEMVLRPPIHRETMLRMAKGSGFQLANDLIWMHGYRGGTTSKFRPHKVHVTKPYQSLPFAIFVLAFAACEERVKDACAREGLFLDRRRTRPMHQGSAGFVERWFEKTGVALAARARTAPQANAGVHRWEVLTASDLDAYLREGYLWRNQLAHEGGPDTLDAPTAAKFKSRFYRREALGPDGKPILRKPMVNLNIAEGMLQAAQDIAYLTATPSEKATWEWVIPRWSSTGRMTDKVAFDTRFPLPREQVEWARDRNAHDPNGWR